MSAKTSIEWTDTTWNPLRGCSRVSEGCRNCYAEKVAMRFRGAGQPYEGLVRMTTQGPKWTGEIKLVPATLAAPLGWAKPRRVFVNSMSDLFHESVPFEFIASVFAVMSVTTRHTYQVLTKRPARMLEFFKWVADGAGCFDDDRISRALPKDIPWEPHRPGKGGYDNCGPGFPYENVWLGVSVEDQKTADERIPLLLQCPADIRWISAEPLLGPVDLTAVRFTASPGYFGDALQWHHQPHCSREQRYPSLDWVVAGGESGHGARPMHPDWARSLRDQCEAAGVKFLFKQHGEWAPGSGDFGAGRFETAAIARDGRVVGGGFDASKYPVGAASADGWSMVHRAGKKAAGRVLDGRTHDEFPEAR